MSFNVTFYESDQVEIPLEYEDDVIGQEDPEKVTLMISAPSDPDRIAFIIEKSNITVLDNDGKYCSY